MKFFFSFSIRELCLSLDPSGVFTGELGNMGDLRWLCQIHVTGLVTNSV